VSFLRRVCIIVILISIQIQAQPGGVSGTQLWLRADIGVHGGATVSQWDDQSGNSRDALQSNTDRQPSYVNTPVNFNPAFYYTNHFLDVAYNAALNGRNLTVLSVIQLDGGSSWRSPWTTRDDNPSRGHILYYNGDYRYWTGHGTNGGWDQLRGGDASGNFEILTTTSVSSGSDIQKNLFLQGANLGDQTVSFSLNTQRPFRIGKGRTETTDGDYPWYGHISEVIVYDSQLSDSDRNRVESYLAVKYGLTLDQSVSGGQDYQDSTGALIWDASENSGYGNDIAGLGRDDISVLDQRISKSINPDAVITMATNSDFSSANSDNGRTQLGDDVSFLLWSNNNDGTGWTSTGAPSGGEILQRQWKIEKSGTQNSISIQVDTDDADFDFDPFTGSLFFVQGDDLSTAKPIRMSNDGGGKWHIENITFTDGELFGFVIAPAVPNNAVLLINELMYRQKTSGSDQIEEFVEFYVVSSGTLKNLIIHDMESTPNPYIFPDIDVSAGDYVIVHKDSGTDSSSGGVHHLYSDTLGFTFNNNGDDLALYRPVDDDMTQIDGEWYFVVPVEYVAFGTDSANDGSVDSPPVSEYNHLQPDWDYTYGTELDGASYGESISLTPNASDSDKAACWELTASRNAEDNGCANYLVTRQTDLTYVHSQGENNNAPMPNMSIVKSSIVLTDPINSTNNPKRIPGATIRYCFTVDNTGEGNAENATISDSLTGNGKDYLSYLQSGSLVQDIAVACDCTAISTTNGTLSGSDVTITIGDINGTGDTTHSRGCAYIELVID